MRSWKSLFLVTVMLLLVPAAAFANGGWQVDVRGGMALPMGDYGDAFKSGLLIGMDASHMMTPMLAIGVDGNYIKNSPTDDSQTALDATFGAGTDAEAKFVHYGAHVKYMLGTKGSKAIPYMVGGGGLYNAKFGITPPGGPEVSDSETKFGLRGGVGANFMVGTSWGIGVQADFHDVMTSGQSSQFIGLAAGLHFNLTPASHQ